MIIEQYNLPFVIGFLIKNDHVLVIKRLKKPWIDKYNGLGGKIKEGEDPTSALIREIREEAGIELGKEQINYTGIVTWDTENKGEYINGMFSFIAYLKDNQQLWHEERSTREGLLSWKQIAFAYDKTNPEIADNIPYFLPKMMETTKPLRYHCLFEKGKMKSVITSTLSQAILL